MTLPTLEAPEADRRTRTLESITDMLAMHNQKQEAKKLADLIGIPKDKRDAFAGLPPEWQKTYATMFQRENAAKQKALSSAGSYVTRELKGRAPHLAKRSPEIISKFSEYINKNVPPDQAIARAIADIEGGSSEQKGDGGSWMESLFGVAPALAKGIANQQEEGEESVWKKLTKEQHPRGEGESDLTYGAGRLSSDPKTMLTELPESINKAIGGSLNPKGLGDLLSTIIGRPSKPPEGQRKLSTSKHAAESKNPFEWLSEKINAKTRAGLSPEELEKHEATANAQAALLQLLVPLFKGKKGGRAIEPTEILPAERPQIAQKPGQIEFKGGKPPSSGKPTVVSPSKMPAKVTTPKKEIKPVVVPSQIKVTPSPDTATEMRVERTQPEKRIYPRLENVELREKQLANHSKYVEEISTDAEERATRAEAKVPKTTKGMQSKQIRIHEAEKQWPLAQESYNKAAGRVRALEDEVAKLKGEARESADTLLELARKDLDDATHNLKQAHENLTGVNFRAGIEGMRDAARNKIQQIQETIADGKTYDIAKMDYSPDLISKANAISKSKKLPSARTSDFYTQTHDIYANEYRNRVGQIDKELKELPKTMAGLSQGRQLQMEKDILNKMIKSAEAEKAIQNRRFALREMAERHKAQERFKRLEKRTDGKSEVSRVAKEKMWKERIQEAKTPDQRGELIDEAIENAVNENPQQSERIRKEGEALKESIEDLFEPRMAKEPPAGKGAKMEFEGGHKKPPPPPHKAKEPAIPSAESLGKAKTTGEAAKMGMDYIRKLQKSIDDMLSKIPVIGKYWQIRDAIFGFVSAAIEEFHKETKFPVTGADVINVIAGRPGYGGLRYIFRKMGKEVGKWAIGFIKASNKEREQRESYRRSVKA